MKNVYKFSALALFLFVLLIGIEVLRDDEPFALASFTLDVFEKGLFALSTVAAVWVMLDIRDMKRERLNMLDDLARVRTESDRWRSAARVHIEGLGIAIRDQFLIWKLSEGEADIALLMLKGLTQREIAHLRGSEEATVRQQAATIYRKSGLSNRSELGAFFLEDLLLPTDVKSTREDNVLPIGRFNKM